MEEEIEREIEALIDKKLKPVKTRLQKLAEAHDAAIAEQKETLLWTQKNIAAVMVRFVQLVLTRSPNFHDIRTELIADSSVTIERIKNSTDPLSVANAFWDKWDKKG